jgi:hypothetical protein
MEWHLEHVGKKTVIAHFVTQFRLRHPDELVAELLDTIGAKGELNGNTLVIKGKYSCAHIVAGLKAVGVDPPKLRHRKK